MNFTVYFLSDGTSDGSETDEGFILNWNCFDFEISWSEWTLFSRNRICNMERKLNKISDLSFEPELLSRPTIQYRNTSKLCGN